MLRAITELASRERRRTTYHNHVLCTSFIASPELLVGAVYESSVHNIPVFSSSAPLPTASVDRLSIALFSNLPLNVHCIFIFHSHYLQRLKFIFIALSISHVTSNASSCFSHYLGFNSTSLLFSPFPVSRPLRSQDRFHDSRFQVHLEITPSVAHFHLFTSVDPLQSH